MPAHQATEPTPRRVDRLDAGIAGVVFALSLGLLAAGDTDLGEYAGDVDVVGVVLTALASLPLVARRRAPTAVFVVTGVASVVLRLVAAPAGPPIGPTVALYTLAASGAEPRRALALAAAMVAAHLTATGLAMDAFPGTEAVLGTSVWAGAWLVGERTRLRTEQMAELEQRAARAERDAERDRRLAAAEERTRIARDLHDSAGHAINVILVHAGLGRLRADTDPAAARAAFETIEDVARETVGEIDDLVGALREDRDEGGVEPPPGVAALDALVDRHRAAGLDVTTRVRGDRRALAPGIDRGAFRILQEALTNAARHGDGGAEVCVAFGPDALELTVANPVARDRVAHDGHGVTGMRERAELLGGSLDAGARGGRFEVHARLPLTRSRR